MSSTWMKLSPSVRGTARLNWTMTRFAARIGGVHRLDARAERAEAVRVGRRGVHEDVVERQHPGLEQPRHVGQEDRHVVGAALLDGRSGVRADEQRPMPEVPRHLRREVRPGPLAVEVDDADVAQLGRARDERVEQDRRRRRGAVEVELLAGADAGDGLRGA